MKVATQPHVYEEAQEGPGSWDRPLRHEGGPSGT